MLKEGHLDHLLILMVQKSIINMKKRGISWLA
jgi:hypothetical protein